MAGSWKPTGEWYSVLTDVMLGGVGRGSLLPMGIYVYMLRCADRSYYVGSATGEDLNTRIERHNAGSYGGYTSMRRPVTLVWSQYFDRITDGIAAERQLKGWSRVKKEALIRNDWAAVQRSARRRGGAAKTR